MLLEEHSDTVATLEFALTKGAGPADAQHERLSEGVVTVSTGAWEAALEAWTTLATSRLCPHVASALTVDAARRCGQLDLVAPLGPLFDDMLRDGPYLSNHQSHVAAVQARRALARWPETIDGLAPEALHRFGSAAMDCHYWRFAIAVWTAFLEQGGGPVEGYRRLGTCLATVGDLEPAVAHLTAAQGLEPDEQIGLKLDRTTRLLARSREPFARHASRLQTNAVIVALKDGLADLLGRNATLALIVTDELQHLSQAVGIDLLALPGHSAGARSLATG